MNYAEKEGFLSKKGVKIRANPWCKRLKTTEVWYLRWTNPRRTLKLSTAADVSLQWSCRKDAVNGRNSLIDKLLETYGRKTTSKVGKSSSKIKLCHPRRKSLRKNLIVTPVAPTTPSTSGCKKDRRQHNPGRPSMETTPITPNDARSKRVKQFVKKKSKTLDREQYAREKLSKLPQIFERVRKKTLHFTTAGTDGYFCNFVRNAAREAEAEMRLEENLADWKRSVNWLCVQLHT